MKAQRRRGQALVEYGLILSLVVLAVLVVISVFGSQIAQQFNTIVNALSGKTAAPSTVPAISSDYMRRTLAYYQAKGRWPPTWGDQRFTELGLNPADWTGLVAGISWNPNGELIGLGNRAGDTTQVYVRDTGGNLLQLYDSWNIWCVASSGKCYYHNYPGGTEVNLNTVEIRTQ